LPGPDIATTEWRASIDYLASVAPAPKFVVLSGSLPPTLAIDSYAQLARLARARGCKVVLDTSGAPLAAALETGVYLIKPSLRELAELTGAPLEDEVQWCAAAQLLVRGGQAELVALSLGERGAMLLSNQGAWRADAVRVDVKSTTGAGDSFLGAMVWALSRDSALPDAFRYAVAAGSAALLHGGTNLCRADDVVRLAQQVHLEPIAAQRG
jgi:6-phosphofructokinase 2